jgi:hypothetical protein
MDFDFTTETITPDSTSILTIGGTGALELPVGTTGQQPVSGLTAGAMRFNTNGGVGNGYIEYYDQSPGWKQFPTTSTTVASFQTSLAGLTPSTATTGAVTLAGTLGATSGGTGTTTAPTAGQLLVGVTGGTYTPFTITSGTGISTTTGSGTFQINNTGVTSAVGTAGNITVSAATGAVTFNLGAVTQSTGSNFVKVTLDGFGRVTGNTAVAQGDLTTLLGTYYLPTAGGTMAGAINMGTNQINNLGMAGSPAGTDAVNVNYVQSQLTGLSWKQAVKGASTVALTTTYANGTAGVGATLTNAGAQAAFTVDGVTFTGSGTERVLIKNQGNTFENGIYVVTTLGSGATNWVLTRATDSDTAAEVDGSAVYIQQGSTLADSGWTETATMTAIGSGNPITWAQFSGAGSYSAGTGLTLTGNTFSLTNPVSLALGGTNAALTAVNGGAVYSTGSALAITAAGTTGQVLTSNGAAAPTWTSLSSSAVTSFSAGTTGFTPNTATTGAVTLAGVLNAVNGGTGQSAYAIGDILFANTTTTLAKLADVAAGSYLRSGGVSTAPVWSTTTLPNSATTGDLMYASGANTYANLADVATGNALISGGVGVAPSWGKIGLTTHVTGVLPIANGGTNSSTALSGSTIMVSNGTSIVQGSAGTTTTVLHGNAAGLPTYGAVSLTADVSGILPLANGGTNANLTAVNGGIVYSSGSAMAISAAGTSGQYLQSNGAAAPTWVTLANGGLKFYSEFTTAPVNAPSATASQSIALGTGSSASTYGVLAVANGQFATAGDAQQMQAVLRALTTATGAGQELFLDGAGASQRLVLPNNSAWTFSIQLVGRRTDATGSIGSWIFTGLIYRDATAGTTTISGLSKTTIARLGVITGAGNDPVVSADTTNGSLKVAVSGYGTYNIRWVATVDLAQVTN